MTSSRLRWALAGIVALALAVRMLHFAAIAGAAFPELQILNGEADTSNHWEWSEAILRGDLLGRDTYHPYTMWMRELAPMDTWYRWWGGKEIFHREPLYPYLLALVRAVIRAVSGSDSVLPVLFVQLVVGALRPLVLFFLGRRLFDERAGLLAAAVGAVYGPFVFFDASLLRDWIPPLLDPLLLVLLLRAASTGRMRDWLLAGLVFGACLLVHATLLLFLPFAIAWAVWRRAEKDRAGYRPGAALLGGLALALLPLAARNVAVGVSPLAISNRGTDAIIVSNAADCHPVGMVMPESFAGIMERSRGSLWTAAVETLATNKGAWGKFLELQGVKLWGLFDTREHADNLDYEYGRAISPVLRYAPSFGLVGFLGLAGLALSLGRGDRRRERLLVAAYVLAAILGQAVAVVVGRYRLGLVAVLIVFASGNLVALWDAFRARAFLAVGVRAALPAAIASIYVLLLPAALRDPVALTSDRTSDYEQAIRYYLEAERYEDALAEVARLKRRAGDHPLLRPQALAAEGFLRCEYGEALVRENRVEDARAQARAAEEAFRGTDEPPIAAFRLGRLWFQAGDRARAEPLLRRFVEARPGSEWAGEAREMLDAIGGGKR